MDRDESDSDGGKHYERAQLGGQHGSCPECGTRTYLHEVGCLELARIQRDQLRRWREAGGDPGPCWAAREAEIDRQLNEAGS